MNKKLALAWLGLIAVGLSIYFYLFRGDLADISRSLRGISETYFWPAAVVYILVLSLRGMTFIPSTPLLFIGMAIFPAHFTFWANMFGILVSCLLVIYAIHRVGVNQALAQVKNKHYVRLRDRIDRNGYYAIVLWSFFPFVPTDAIVYVASSMDVSRKKIVAGVMTGEAILNASYVYGGGMLIKQLMP